MFCLLLFFLFLFTQPGHCSTDDDFLPPLLGRHCDRTCKENENFHCIFNFRILSHFSNCLGDDEGCYGDGSPRNVTLIDDYEEDVHEIPAPTIAVCQGDEVTVGVLNEHESDTGTIHWHGLYMRNTQSSDGVPGVTQCPIQPREMFPWYHFVADRPGTYWFHSHKEFQRDDGANGPLIVRETSTIQAQISGKLGAKLSETCDKTEHTIMIQEWYSSPAQHRYLHNKDDPPSSLLINGNGRSNTDSSFIVRPWPIFTVDPNECSYYRFRFIGAMDLHCPVQVTIEDHSFTLIATDGEYVIPEEDVATLTLANGERFDILIDVSHHQEKTYEMRFSGSPGDFTNCKGLSAIAFLQYGSSEVDQTRETDYQTSASVPGRHVNPLPTIELPHDQVPIPVSSLSSIHPLIHIAPADKTFYLQLGDGDTGANINNIQFDLNSLKAPLLSQEDDQDPSLFCDESYTKEGQLCDPLLDRNSCTCTHILQVETGDVVDLFFINPDLEKPIAHPVHLHGYSFNVLGSGLVPDENPLKFVREMNEAGQISRNLDKPVAKDSLQTIPGGYVLVRFYADNPGYWLMHCHISFDVIEGQVLIFKVGDKSQWDIPENFPQCGKK